MSGPRSTPARDRPLVLLENRCDPTDPGSIDAEELIDVMAAVLSAEGVQADAEAGLHLVGLDEITELNAEHMGVDGPTDVLSFPVDGAGEPAPRVAGPHLVGDVVICPRVAAANAPDHAGTIDDECRLLVVHGALHLCGWDHADPPQRQRMWRRERELMSALDVLPGSDPWRQS